MVLVVDVDMGMDVIGGTGKGQRRRAFDDLYMRGRWQWSVEVGNEA
jgi:hypothetical protein